MEKIAVFLKTTVMVRNRKRNNYEEKSYVIRTNKKESKEELFKYLNNFSLFGYKYFSQLNLGKIHSLIHNPEFRTITGINKFKEYSFKIKLGSSSQK